MYNNVIYLPKQNRTGNMHNGVLCSLVSWWNFKYGIIDLCSIHDTTVHCIFGACMCQAFCPATWLLQRPSPLMGKLGRCLWCHTMRWRCPQRLASLPLNFWNTAAPHAVRMFFWYKKMVKAQQRLVNDVWFAFSMLFVACIRRIRGPLFFLLHVRRNAITIAWVSNDPHQRGGNGCFCSTRQECCNNSAGLGESMPQL